MPTRRFQCCCQCIYGIRQKLSSIQSYLKCAERLELNRDHSLMPRSVKILNEGEYVHLTDQEIRRQKTKGMKYRISRPIVVTCLYKGKPESVTVPVDRVFDGDSLKRMLCLEDDGIAWAVHDWLYNTHAFDPKQDGTTTAIDTRWPVDELMYALLAIEGYKLYGKSLQLADTLAAMTLDRAWHAVNDNVFIRTP